jgi:hypothetical protein
LYHNRWPQPADPLPCLLSANVCLLHDVLPLELSHQAVTSKTFLVSLLVEFIGTMMFTFLGSTVTDKVSSTAAAMCQQKGLCDLSVISGTCVSYA